MTKTVIKFLNKGGIVFENMPENFPNDASYTDVPPIEDLELERQRFIPDINEWINLGVTTPEEPELSEEIKAVVMFAVQSAELTNEQSLLAIQFYNPWVADFFYKEGFKVVDPYDETILYRCRQDHTSSAEHPPGIATAALWEIVNESQVGSIADPITAMTNMEYFKNKYYIEDGVLYLCTRDSEQPLYHLPSALVGNYFKVVEQSGGE